MQSCRQGIVRSVSIVACGQRFDDAVDSIKELPGIGIGVHLCLLAEKPVLLAMRVPSLTDKNGCFWFNYRDFIFRLWTARINMNEVELELEAQIKKVVEKGIRPTHFDTHQYLHFTPEILEILIKLSLKYDVKCIRYPACLRRTPGITAEGVLKTAWLSFYASGHAQKIRANNINFPDHSYAVDRSGILDKRMIERYLNGLNVGVNDMTCHPGYHPENVAYADWGFHWEDELAVLTDPEVIERLASLDIRLINYAH